MALNKSILKLFLLLLASLSLYFYFIAWKSPIDNSLLYYRNRIGQVYVADTSTCFDVCFFPSVNKIPAHANSFSPITTQDGYPSDYARDKNSVYWKGQVVTGADPATFTVSYDGTRIRDKNGYYIGGISLYDFIIQIDPEIPIPDNRNIEVVGYSLNHLLISTDSGIYTVYTQDQKITKGDATSPVLQ